MKHQKKSRFFYFEGRFVGSRKLCFRYKSFQDLQIVPKLQQSLLKSNKHLQCLVQQAIGGWSYPPRLSPWDIKSASSDGLLLVTIMFVNETFSQLFYPMQRTRWRLLFSSFYDTSTCYKIALQDLSASSRLLLTARLLPRLFGKMN